MDFFSGIDSCIAGHFANYTVTHRNIPGFYGIQYNHSGKMRLRINDGIEHLAEDACVFTTYPGALFEYGSQAGEGRQPYFVCFKGPRVEQFIKSGLFPMNDKSPLIKINHPEQFRQSMFNLEKAIYSKTIKHDRAVLMIEELLLQLYEQTSPDDILPAWQAPFFDDLIARIETEPQKKWDFNIEASKLNMTASHFRRLFKKLCGCPPRQYLLHQRLCMAATMLSDSSAPVNIIASQVGIDDIFYFSKAFKEKYTVSPSEYRKEFSEVFNALHPEGQRHSSRPVTFDPPS